MFCEPTIQHFLSDHYKSWSPSVVICSIVHKNQLQTRETPDIYQRIRIHKNQNFEQKILETLQPKHHRTNM